MKPGKDISIEGAIPSKSKGFHITILTGYERPIEAQLRISAKFSDEGNVILLKHFGGRVWNLDDHFHGLLETNSTFTVQVTCLSKEFTVKHLAFLDNTTVNPNVFSNSCTITPDMIMLRFINACVLHLTDLHKRGPFDVFSTCGTLWGRHSFECFRRRSHNENYRCRAISAGC